MDIECSSARTLLSNLVRFEYLEYSEPLGPLGPLEHVEEGLVGRTTHRTCFS